MFIEIVHILTPSLSQPVQFSGWKMHGRACKQYIFRSYVTSTSNAVSIDEKILSYASAKRGAKCSRVSIFFFFFFFFFLYMWHHGSEGVNNNYYYNAWLKTKQKNNNNNLTNATAHFLDFTFNLRTFAVEGRTTSCLPWQLDLAVGHSALRFVVVMLTIPVFMRLSFKTEFPISRRPYTGGTRYGRHLTARLCLWHSNKGVFCSCYCVMS